MIYQPPEHFNIADYFLDARIREGKGDRPAIRTDEDVLSYRQVQRLANRFGNVLTDAGAEAEQRVMIALPDVPEFVGALFGVLKIGGVVVMVNPGLQPDAIRALVEYTRAKVVVVHAGRADAFREAVQGLVRPPQLLVLGEEELDGALEAASDTLETFDSHRDDPAVWLFSGGTTGRPKAVVQSHTSFANTTECYGKGVLGLTEADITLSVPKLYFGYATGSNLLFPFSVGASCALFTERCTADVLFEKIALHRPTLLVNVPTMINHMVSHPDASAQDLSSLRICTSAGAALPADLHERWNAAFGVDLLDGLGTAEMWHIFLSNRPGDVRPGTLGRVVPGFEVRICDDDGDEVPPGEVGWMWVRGNSRAVGYWQNMDKTREAFRGEWYASNDMVVRDEEGVFRYCGRGDDMLKVSGKWLSPGEVENCLLQHPAVEEVAVVGVEESTGLVKPHAFVVASVATSDPRTPSDDTATPGRATPERPTTSVHTTTPGLEDELQDWVKSQLAPYKYPRRVVLMDELPRTHLGKVDRGALKRHP
jgi:benzoate-CoA ligase family protein